MGWLWTSSSSAPAPSNEGQVAEPSRAELPPHSTASSNQNRHATPPAPAQPRRKLTRDEQAELEFQDMMKELSAPPPTIVPRSGDSPAPRLENEEYSIHPTNLYPREMSCRAAFDQAFYCQSMGGQVINVYRYGHMRSCSELWNNFWFCMRTTKSGFGEEKLRQKLKQHYWEKDKRYREGPSSEDVWEMRDRMAESPFSADWAAIEAATKPHREMMKRRYRNFIHDRPFDAPEGDE